MGDDLEARLKTHQRAFEGLMSLIPAKDYYGKDESITSTEWTRVGKKQSKAERRAAKRAKLDPANQKSALDVLEENARKRKRELEAEADGDASSDFEMDIEKEKPGEGMKTASGKTKKQKTTKDADADATSNKQTKDEEKKAAQEARAKAKAEKQQAQREKKKEKQAQKQQSQQAKKAQQQEFSKTLTDTAEPEEEDDAAEATDEDKEHDEDDDDQIQAMDVSGLVDEETATPSAADSNASTASLASASSSSSMPPPSEIPQKKEKKSLIPDEKKHEEFRARLQARLEEMRAKRKADGPDGRPAKNRAELIEARRKKEAERKAAKKAQRQLAQEDEERLKAEEQLTRIRGGSGSPSIFSHQSSPDRDRNLSFGRVAWSDGKQLDGDLSGFRESKKQKGRSDPKTALEAAKNKQARLGALDEEKRKKIEEQDLWLNAKRRAQGERVHDDPKLLKKSVKRLDKQKAKSSREWGDRKEAVEKGIEARQKKREENLRKRRDEKGMKGKKKASKPGKKVKKRAGFEGTFKAK
ncbi:SURF6-domain-containing protein [Bimuria novae-zelandiae CBS 107.79]|uniref:SURF6-domain-containing protein n=1 Tax=Bimuria novae-zelandiae CBS 107.79 TaxID=1447943 RepID=A0A6A5VRJ2_9PLEO|nr:SURF6-domain-containing protein [Bimuria novae-zelandiae CBS 107.79]